MEKRLVIGILAHVDAGKTTLTESLLYRLGKLRKMGRVDHGDAFLDTHTLERERGITIFSKQAVFELADMQVTLLDTPGHTDFSAETERTLSYPGDKRNRRCAGTYENALESACDVSDSDLCVCK